MKYFLIIFFLIINFVFFFNLKKISFYINIYDIPDNIRKFHNNKVPLLGGIVLYLNIIFLLIYSNFLNYNIPLFLHYNSFLLVTFFFLIGILDDKINVKPLFKLFILSLALIIFFYESRYSISTLNFKFFSLKFNLNYSSVFFTTLCVMLFLNALNMFDGINNQVNYYSIFLIVSLLFYKFDIYYLLLIIPLLFLCYYNFTEKIFLGDSGVYLISLIISLKVLELHNEIPKLIHPEEIFLLMFIPGVDMFRLFIHRIILRRNPFSSDRLHLHHLLLKKINFNLVSISLTLVSLLFWLLFIFFANYYILFFFCIFYFSVFILVVK
jgi:UDP-GlcNAc:undecaprenyl-phosphate GlcNAc-1-phosphate transferase